MKSLCLLCPIIMVGLMWDFVKWGVGYLGLGGGVLGDGILEVGKILLDGFWKSKVLREILRDLGDLGFFEKIGDEGAGSAWKWRFLMPYCARQSRCVFEMIKMCYFRLFKLFLDDFSC